MESSSPSRRSRRTEALSADAIVGAAIAVLDAEGEDALTFRSLSTALRTGPGAIYHHLSSKQEILASAATRLVREAIAAVPARSDAEGAVRAVMLALFDLIDSHPWVGAQLAREPWQAAVLEIFESVGGHLDGLGVEDRRQFGAASTLTGFVLGVAGQYAAAARLSRDVERSAFLREIATGWRGEASAASRPFVHRMADRLAEHDEREQFAEGVDVILAGIVSLAAPPLSSASRAAAR